jgi:hypothetical protein
MEKNNYKLRVVRFKPNIVATSWCFLGEPDFLSDI